jgi:small subunit ribosomal protein S5
MSNRNGWQPQTRLGRKVVEGDIETMEEALNSGLPLKEPELVDQLLPGLEDEVLDINMVQRMTDSGRRVKFRCVCAIGNRDGFVGYAEGRDDQVGGAIQKAIDIAKLNIIDVPRGAGSWEDRSDRPHSLTHRTTGKAGSVEVELIPAPAGLGLAATDTGNTRTTLNLAKATYNALENASQARGPRARPDEEPEVAD